MRARAGFRRWGGDFDLFSLGLGRENGLKLAYREIVVLGEPVHKDEIVFHDGPLRKKEKIPPCAFTRPV